MESKWFDFSIVMAVYNVEEYLDEAIQSLVEQDYGFGHVQLILVDDGSRDKSGAICDEYKRRYPENICVIHQENAGVSVARNEGLKLATGKYINFMDSDDKLEKNALSEVKSFFDEHIQEVKIVSIPFRFFDGQSGDGHPQNKKFLKGKRIINLNYECTSYQLSMGSSFVVRQAMGSLQFDKRLQYMEDAKLILQFLEQNGPFLGVINTTHYLYRKRTNGTASATQSSRKTNRSYLPVLHYFHGDLIRMFGGKPPRFVQSVMAYDLQWRWQTAHFPIGILTSDEQKEYADILYSLVRYLDDDIICGLGNINSRLKCYLLCRKYSCKPLVLYNNNDYDVFVKDVKVGKLSDCGAQLDFLEIKSNHLLLEGWVKTFWGEQENFRAVLDVNGELYDCEPVIHPKLAQLSLENIVDQTFAFRCNVDLTKYKSVQVRLVIQYREKMITKKITSVGPYFPISRKYKNAYIQQDGRLVTLLDGGLYIEEAHFGCGIRKEVKLLRELWKVNAPGGRKAILVRLLTRTFRKLKRKPVWLISDRPNKADDNGEALFRFLRKVHPEIYSVFVIQKSTSDAEEIKKVGPIVGTMSTWHKLLFLICDYNISSQADDIISNPFPGYSEPYRDALATRKNVFLQHGITKDDLSGWLNKYSKNLHGFITAAEPEYNSIIHGNYCYTDKEVWLTGFPRFDRLYNETKKIVTIAPTWRKYLTSKLDQKSGVWSLAPDFQNSQYIKFYLNLLSDVRLLEAAKKYGYEIHFLPHPNLQAHLDMFPQLKSVHIHGMETKYRDIYAHTALLVTDYSSVCFDFAYLRKPIVYCQFDADTFFSGGHSYTKGYFDYERDGFGEVEYTLEGTMARIVEYMENDCKMKPQYEERVNRFFAYNDKNSCQRVYNMLIKHY